MKAVPDFVSPPVKKMPVWAILFHIGFWLLFIVLELAYLKDLMGTLEPPIVYIFYYLLNIGLFYGQLWLFGSTFGHNRYPFFKKSLIFLGIVVLYLALKYEANHLLVRMHMPKEHPVRNLHSFLTAALYRGWTFTFMAAFYGAAAHLSAYSLRAKEAEQQQQLIRAEAEKQLADARVAYLQQQLNPHLLFNALNFIYTSVYRHSEEGARSVELLSEIMRFSLSGTGPDGKAALADELEQVVNLVELNAARFEEPLRLHLQISGEPGNHRIMPLILLTLTENIFKHGHLLDPACPAELRLHTGGDNRLTYYSRNRKKTKTSTVAESRIGLQNARIRLDHAYGRNYQLEISETEEFFELTLTLPV